MRQYCSEGADLGIFRILIIACPSTFVFASNLNTYIIFEIVICLIDGYEITCNPYVTSDLKNITVRPCKLVLLSAGLRSFDTA